MSIVIQINTDLEQRLREKALKRGIEVNQYISQFLEHIFPNNTSPTQPSVSDREASLLQQINLDIAPEQWQSYLKLKEKQQKGKLSKNQHVVPLGNGWAVKGEGNSKYTAITQRKTEAIIIARSIAKNNKSEIIIHGKDCKIQDKDSYVNDRNPTKEKAK